MDIKKTIGTPEQQELIERVGTRMAEITGASKLVIKGHIRKAIEAVIGDYSMMEISGDASQLRLKVFMETAKKAGAAMGLDEKMVLREATVIYENWKKEFGLV